MPDLAAFLVGRALATPFGTDIRANCDALYAGKNTFRVPSHFDSKGRRLGLDPELDEGRGSRAVRLLDKLRAAVDFDLPSDTALFLSTTVGAIDLLEQGETGDTSAFLLEEAERIFGLRQGILVSAACASGQTAVSLALEQLAAGSCRHALVIGCDITSEFVTAGFTALGACTRTICRPYDANRDGLTLGEAAAAVLLSRKESGFGRILAAAESCDAAHITAPDLEGRILQDTIRHVLTEENPAGIIGHGTGTVYNDQAEAAALRQVFPGKCPPLFSLKGNYGHTLGATGVLQLVLGMEFARRRTLPPQAGLRQRMEGTSVSSEKQQLTSGRLLSLNVGFGGLNSAVVLEGS